MLQYISLGVTWCNPDIITQLPELPWHLPQSCVMLDGVLYNNGDRVGPCTCPPLSVSHGDDVSIQHTNTQLMFYKNQQLHYTWDVEMPTPVWAAVGLWMVNKISIKSGQLFKNCENLKEKLT